MAVGLLWFVTEGHSGNLAARTRGSPAITSRVMWLPLHEGIWESWKGIRVCMGHSQKALSGRMCSHEFTEIDFAINPEPGRRSSLNSSVCAVFLV